MTDREHEQLARQLCTPKEADAYILWKKGAGYRRVADLLDISFSTARDRIHRAIKKINAHQEEAA